MYLLDISNLIYLKLNIQFFPTFQIGSIQLMIKSKILQSYLIFLSLIPTSHLPEKTDGLNFKIQLESDQLLLFPLTHYFSRFELL